MSVVWNQPPFWARAPHAQSQHVGLTLVTGPTSEPITVDEVKTYLRLDVNAGEPAPTVPTVTLVAAAGLITAGVHRWLWVFRTADGHTEAGAVSAPLTTDLATHGQATVMKPVGGSAVTFCDLYRTAAGGATYLLVVAGLANDGATYTDNIADAALGAQAPSTNTTADPEIAGWITAARQMLEAYLDIALLPQTWRQTLSYFPRLPIRGRKGPLQTTPTPPVITYIDGAGVAQTWDVAQYTVSAPAGPYPQPWSIVPAFGQTVFPVTSPLLLEAVTIQFVAGYATAADVPAFYKTKLKQLIGNWYTNRGDAEAGQTVETAILRSLDSFGLVGVA